MNLHEVIPGLGSSSLLMQESEYLRVGTSGQFWMVRALSSVILFPRELREWFFS